MPPSVAPFRQLLDNQWNDRREVYTKQNPPTIHEFCAIIPSPPPLTTTNKKKTVKTVLLTTKLT